jgi:hypothetical protein
MDLSVFAHTGSGTTGYSTMAMVDRNTGTFELHLCDGTWTIDPPYLQNRQAPSAPVVIVGEIPDTVKSQDIVYTVLGIDDANQLPTQYSLMQNYPNPFNSSTSIEYTVPIKTHVTIEVVNLLGETVKTLIDKELSAGVHRVNWNGTDNAGKAISSGIYLYRIKTGDFNQTKKMILVK